MKKANNTKIKRLLSVLSIVLLCAMISTTFAWFIFDETATLRNKGDMQITAGDRLEISIDRENWGHTLEPAFEKSPTLPDITGDGTVFYYPTVLDANDKTLDNKDTFHTINMNDPKEYSSYFITLTIYFRSASNLNVYLANTSSIDPQKTTYDGDNKSMFGDISSDYIAGAARVAFLEKDLSEEGQETQESQSTQEGQETLKNIWIPNESIELYYDKTTGRAKINDSGTRETFEKGEYPYGYKYIEGDQVLSHSYGWDAYRDRLVTVGKSALAIPAKGSEEAKINNAAPLLSFSDTNGKIQEKALTIRIWIEGTDRESDKALVGGKMNYIFNFIGIKKGDSRGNIENLSLDNDGLLLESGSAPESSVLEYSYDGIEWASYSSGSLIRSGKTEVFVRYKEEKIYAPSAVKTFSLVTENTE